MPQFPPIHALLQKPIAPEWSKFAGERLADRRICTATIVRDLHHQARAVSFHLAIVQELRRSGRSHKSHPRRPRVLA